MVTREPFWYLASPYSGYGRGVEAAFQEASRATADFALRGVKIFHLQDNQTNGSVYKRAIDTQPKLEIAIFFINVKG